MHKKFARLHKFGPSGGTRPPGAWRPCRALRAGASVPSSLECPVTVAVAWTCETGLVSDLLLRCGRGDHVALARLFDLVGPLVTAVVAERAEPEQVPDRLTAAFAEVWRCSPGYRPAVHGATGAAGGTGAVGWILARVAEVSETRHAC